MLISPAAVSALCDGNRLTIRYIGDYSAGLGVFYKRTDGDGYNKVGRAFARAPSGSAFLPRFRGIFALIAEIRKGGQITVRLKNYIAAAAAVAAVGSSRRDILLPVKGDRAITAVARL